MATGQVKSVSVVFQAFTDKFEKATNRAGNQMTNFAKKAAGIVGGFLAGRAAVGAFRKQLGELDRLGKLSDRMQIDPNTLRGMDLAASQLGTNFSQVEKGVQRMSRTIGEAREGITTGTTALKDLGLTAEDFSGMNVEQQYKMIADRIKDIEDPSRKAAVAFRIFGRSGQEMLNMLNLGAEGLEKYKKEAEALGGPIDLDDIAQVEAANDAMDKMKRTFEGMVQQFAIALAPALEDFATSMKDLLSISGDIRNFWKDVQLSIGAALIQWKEFTGALSAAEAEDAMVMLYDDIFKQQKKLKDGMKNTSGQTAPAKVLGQSLKSFTNAAQFQSSKAFDILNPNRPGSVAQENKKANERTADAVEKLADGEAVKLVQKDIK